MDSFLSFPSKMRIEREKNKKREKKKKREGENDVSPSSFLSSSSWERKYRLPVLAKILIRNPPKKIERHFPKVLQKKDTRTRTHERGANSSSSTSSSFNRERERD